MNKISNRFNFTKAAIEGLPPSISNQPQYYFDTVQRNLAIRVSPKGLKVFCLYRKKNGEKLTPIIGRFPEIPVSRARALCLAMLNEIEEGVDIVAAKKALRNQPTLDEFFQDYIESHAKLKKVTWKYDLDMYLKHIKPVLGKVKLSELTRGEIFKLHSHISENRGKVIANRVVNLIGVVHNKAVEFKVLTHNHENPTKYVTRNPEYSRSRFISESELPHFLEALEQDASQDIKDFFYLSIISGARKTNVLSTLWVNVSFKDKTWLLPKTKNGSPHTVALVAYGLAIFERRRANTTGLYVFPSVRGATHMKDPKKAWKRVACAMSMSLWKTDPSLQSFIASVENKHPLKNGESFRSLLSLFKLVSAEAERQSFVLPKVVDITIHDVRRTIASYLSWEGVNQLQIASFLGQKSLGSTMVYARTSQDVHRNSVQAVLKSVGIFKGE